MTDLVPANASSPSNLGARFEWDAKKLRAIDLLVQGKKIKDIAAELEVSPDAIYDWKKIAEFKNQLDLYREEIYQSLINRQMEVGHKAIDKLEELIESGNNRQRVQLDASIAILKQLPSAGAKEKKDEEGGSGGVKVVIVNETTLENRRTKLKSFDEALGYDLKVDRVNVLHSGENEGKIVEGEILE